MRISRISLTEAFFLAPGLAARLSLGKYTHGQLAMMVPPAQRAREIEKEIEAYEAALRVAGEDGPVSDRAVININKGSALFNLALIPTSGSAPQKIKDAIAAFREAIEAAAQDFDVNPGRWGRAKSGLGAALYELPLRSERKNHVN